MKEKDNIELIKFTGTQKWKCPFVVTVFIQHQHTCNIISLLLAFCKFSLWSYRPIKSVSFGQVVIWKLSV